MTLVIKANEFIDSSGFLLWRNTVNDKKQQYDRQALVDLIQDLVEQSCGTDSCAISVYAEAMPFLAKERRCRIMDECGRRVIIEWIK